MDAITRHCSACGEERLFEQPPCFDGHGDDCPERACAGCGSAVLIQPAPVTAACGRAGTPTAASQAA